MSNPTPDAPKPRLLLIDDEPGNLVTFQRVLRGRYDIVLASGGAEALVRIHAEPAEARFDVVVLDYSMPRMNGGQFLARLRDTHPHVPCIFLTAYAEIEEVKRASGQYKVAAVILKPWERADLEHRIDHVIRLGKMRRTVAAIRT